MKALWLLVGAAISGPVWIALTALALRRLWQSTRKLASRTKRTEHLVELGQVVGGLAHEIKNPLSTVNVNLKLLTEDLDRHPTPDHQRWLRRLKSVQNEADRLREILDDFLKFAGKYELCMSRVDLRVLIDELIDFFAPQADAARIVMRSSIADEPIECSVDAKLIKQAMLNLLINAVQAMPAGGELLIKLSAQRGKALVEVIDTGGGMTAEEASKIFEAYYSTKTQGTGLGLPTTRRIVREHSGTINVESQPGTGTRFTIALPLAKG